MEDIDFLRELGTISFVTRLKRVSDAMLHDGRKVYKHFGYDIEPNWFVIFKLLEKYGELTVMEIADKIGMTHPSVIAIINKMLKLEYLAEKKSPSDSRKRILFLTPKAKDKLPEFEKIWDAGTAGFKRMLDGSDAFAFLDELEDKINDKGFKTRTLEEIDKLAEARIIEFEEKYAGDFASLNYDWISKGYKIEGHDREILDDPVNYIIDAGGQIFFALIGEQVAGTVALMNMDEETLELAKMAVSTKFRGYNIGLKLINACIEYSKKKGKKRILLESNTKQIAAINLYKKVGFKEIPLDPNTPYARANIRMEKKLD
ncbi:MAG: helix-turn-helix domain-containing GNAT family N-acetyltransferase [Pyrinomonadaceae bacterium]